MVSQRTPARKGAAAAADFSHVASCSESTAGPASKSHVKVVVRVRPENQRERDSGFKNVVRVMDEQMLIFDPREEESPDFYRSRKRSHRNITKRQSKDMQFVFDRVFGDSATSREVYESTTKEILDSFFEGFNCSVFAYGATGAGKTHTMLGSEDQPGIMFHTMKDLYQRIDEMKADRICDVAISYLEVYNEQIRDLLMPGDYLPLREDPQKTVVVTGLSLHKPTSAEELLRMLACGNRNRTQHPTDANAESSRSHAVLQVFMRQKDRTASMSADVQVAKMSLIDLAGSERATVTTNRGARFREGANINRSLLALGNCINALAEGKSSGYVPYRNSKLTRLLKDSLGGNCRTLMIAAVSPSSMSFEDTYNTLKYANRAKSIKASLKKNVLSVDFHISQYPKIIEKLKEEVLELRGKLQDYEDGKIQIQIPKTLENLPPDTLVDTCKFRETFVNIFRERFALRRDLNNLEVMKRDLKQKISFEQIECTRLSLILSDSEELAKVKERTERLRKRSANKKKHIASRLEEIHIRLEANEHRLQAAQAEAVSPATEGKLPEVLGHCLRALHLECQLRDTQQHVRALKRLCAAQERHAQASEKLVCSLLQTVKKQFFLLQSHNMTTSDMIAGFAEIQQMARHRKEVAWADFSGMSLESDAMTPSSSGTPPPPAPLDKEFEEMLTFPVAQGTMLTPARSNFTPAKGGYLGPTPRRTPRVGRSPQSQKSSMKHVRRRIGKITEEDAIPMQALTPAKETPSRSISVSNPPITKQTDSVTHPPPPECTESKGLPQPTLLDGDTYTLPLKSDTPASQSARALNVTFTTEDGVFPLQPSLAQPPATSRDLPSAPQLAGGDPNSTITIDTSTVVKSRPSVEGVPEVAPVAKSVIRAMDFSSPKTQEKLSKDAGSSRSPLMSRENLTSNSNDRSDVKQKPKVAVKSNLHHQTLQPKTTNISTVNDSAKRNMIELMKLGLPSALDRHSHVSRADRPPAQRVHSVSAIPNYMLPTKSASIRHKFGRSGSASPDARPRKAWRVHTKVDHSYSRPGRVADENHKPLRRTVSMRSQSASAGFRQKIY